MGFPDHSIIWLFDGKNSAAWEYRIDFGIWILVVDYGFMNIFNQARYAAQLKELSNQTGIEGSINVVSLASEITDLNWLELYYWASVWWIIVCDSVELGHSLLQPSTS
jgi:hypothetical protein